MGGGGSHGAVESGYKYGERAVHHCLVPAGVTSPWSVANRNDPLEMSEVCQVAFVTLFIARLRNTSLEVFLSKRRGKDVC